MSPEQILSALLATWHDHVKLPEQWAWATLGIPAVVALGGFTMMWRGARWAPGVMGIAFAGLGLLGGHQASVTWQLPLGPALGGGALIGLIAGVWMFRFWQALLLGIGAASAGVCVYYVRDLTPAVSQWLGDGHEITLRPAGTVVGAEVGTSFRTEVASLWQHLTAAVPSFEFNIYTIIIAAGVAGIFFGWMLPRASRALWASTVGTICAGVGVTAIMQKVAPEQLQVLLNNNTVAWAVVGSAWAVSFALNYAAVRPRPAKPAEPESEVAPARA